MEKYEYRINWSEEDKVYIARVVEFPSLAAHGSTYESALKELRYVVRQVLEEIEGNEKS